MLCAELFELDLFYRSRMDTIRWTRTFYQEFDVLENSNLKGKQKINVFIADDRSRSRAGLRALLATRPEFEIIGEATNGKEAVDLIESRQPDVVLMDANMPVMSGIEATRIIKDRWPQIKVIVLTLYSSYEVDAQTSGADAFLVKGGCPENLFEVMKT